MDDRADGDNDVEDDGDGVEAVADAENVALRPVAVYASMGVWWHDLLLAADGEGVWRPEIWPVVMTLLLVDVLEEVVVVAATGNGGLMRARILGNFLNY